MRHHMPKPEDRFPLLASQTRQIPPSWIPFWLARIVYARYTKEGGRQEMVKIHRSGGFLPDMMLDLMRGGSGIDPVDLAGIAPSTKSFPVLPAPVTDGTMIPPSEIPRWLADYAYRSYVNSGRPDVVDMDTLEKLGGFGANQLLDLLAGGNSDGQAWATVLKGSHKSPASVRRQNDGSLEILIGGKE